jgi:hypothetical protein
MKYADLVNAIAAAFSADARVLTRYNYIAVTELDETLKTNLTMRHTKLVVADYADVSGTIKMMQLGSETVVPTVEQALTKIGESDADFRTFAQTTQITALDVQEALAYAGLDIKYAVLVRSILNVAPAHLAKDRPTIRLGASKRFGNESVSLFIQLEDMVLIVQIKE